MTSPLEHSLKARIRAIAKEQRTAPALLWENLVLERFLVRLAHSQYADKFILKGGMLLSRYVNINRHTQDLDFSIRQIRNLPDLLENVLQDIIAVPIEDGFEFADLRVDKLVHDHMEYAGIRALMNARFGKIRFRVQIDLGFGDEIEPITRPFALLSSSKGSLFESYINIACYPKEFIFAEKLETIVFRGADNSRVKDYHDLYVLIQSYDRANQNLERIIHSVFEHRQTPLNLPIHHSPNTAAALQQLWDGHCRALPRDHAMPADFSQVLQDINEWLQNHSSLCE